VDCFLISGGIISSAPICHVVSEAPVRGVEISHVSCEGMREKNKNSGEI